MQRAVRAFFSFVLLGCFGVAVATSAVSAQVEFPGDPSGLQATDGTFSNRVDVNWTAPVGGGAVTSYRLFRYACVSAVASQRFCAEGDYLATLSSATLSYSDSTVTVSQLYCYSVQSVGSAPNLLSNCSNIDSGYAWAPPDYDVPAVSSTDGTFRNKIRVTWVPPGSGSPFTNFQIHRSETAVPPVNSLYRSNIPASPGTFEDIVSDIVPGRLYYYWLRGIVGQTIDDGQIDPGYARISPPENVGASDGVFENKVAVSWSPPTLGGDITGYHLYRDTENTACQKLLAAGLPSGAGNYDDSAVTPGVKYYYSLVTLSPTGPSECSLVNEGFARLGKPVNVAASDGTYPDKVLVTWTPPANSGPIAGFRLFRDVNPTSCAGTPITSNINSNAVSYNDFGVDPGVVYYYSMQTLSAITGANSSCSNLDPGHAKIGKPTNVQATDGTYPDKVVVTWQPPSGSGPISGYKLYRDLTPTSCVELLQDGLPSGSSSFDDTSVIPGVVYHYSVKTLSPTGESLCSNVDSGFARVGSPLGVSASDGTFPDKVYVFWTPPPGSGTVTGYNLYRDSLPTPCSSLLVSGLGSQTLTYDDFAVNPGAIYYYSVKTLSSGGQSSCSIVDSGFASRPLPICSNGLDDDNDGLIDLQDPGCKGDPTRETEKDESGPACDNGIDDDGDGKIDYRLDGNGDPGCYGPTDPSEDDSDIALRSPAYVKFNTFLGQWNYAELINDSGRDKTVDITIFNLRGQEMIKRAFVVPAGSEVDVDVNNLLMIACNVLNSNCSGFEDLSRFGAPNGLDRPDGVVDTYGLVKMEFDDDDPEERLLGRMSFYRLNPDGESYSFGFAREFRNPLNGPSYSVSNTIDPQGLGNLVPNWAEVINFDAAPQEFTMNIYTQAGVLVSSKKFTLASLAEFDFQAGHEFVDSSGKVNEGVYLVEVLPKNNNINYFLSVSRYSSNSPNTQEAETYNFAFNLDASPGTTEAVYAPINNTLTGVQGLKSTVSITNWAEVANVGSEAGNVTLLFKDGSGNVIDSETTWIPPRAQFHYNASAVLPAGTAGALEVHGSVPVLVQSMTYVHGALNQLQTAFASTARPKGRAIQAGSINTFLQMQSVLQILSTGSNAEDVSFEISSFRGGQSTGVISLSQGGASVLQISNNPAVGFPAETYGALKIDTGEAGKALGEVWRVRVVNGDVDFVMPTRVQ